MVSANAVVVEARIPLLQLWGVSKRGRKKIKAIFFDIDGTLISGKRPFIKKEVIEGLKQVRQKGIQLFIASGRHMLELEELKLVEQFDFDGYLLLNGGYCMIGSQIIYDNKIDQEDLKEIVKVVKENKYPCLFIESNQMYINHVNQRVIDAQASISTMIPPINNQINLDNIYQVDPYVDEKEIKEIIKNAKHVKVTKWHDYAYDIVPKTGGKAAAIQAVSKYLGYQKEELMAFGDGHNDIEMLDAVGYPIAMENGSDEVKQHACYICDEVEKEGILKGLKYFNLIDQEKKKR